ncbi:uncharacterized protein [Symphalangus syndactylus]|uniref:uncharacterized protein isoform X2 n=1 Tax=Symphalangus syndactylus TaxID=9590 RepID=UPI0030078372
MTRGGGAGHGVRRPLAAGSRALSCRRLPLLPRASTQPREEELPATSGLPSGSARPLPQTRPGKRREGAGGDAEAGSAGGRQGWRRGRREAGGGSPAYSRSRQEPNPSPPHRAEHRLMWHKCSINAHGLR